MDRKDFEAMLSLLGVVVAAAMMFVFVAFLAGVAVAFAFEGFEWVR